MKRQAKTKCISCDKMIIQPPKGGIRKRCEDCNKKEQQARLFKFWMNDPREDRA